MRRISSGKRIELTMRDIELFKLLYRYQYLRSDFLYAFLGGESEIRFDKRAAYEEYHGGREGASSGGEEHTLSIQNNEQPRRFSQGTRADAAHADRAVASGWIRGFGDQ
jgi:hypothetical protein